MEIYYVILREWNGNWETTYSFTSENIHTLSNLTLLTNGENDRAKNKSYTAKKAIYHDSEYIINKYFDSVDDWSVESAKAWEQYLQEMVCKVFVVWYCYLIKNQQ